MCLHPIGIATIRIASPFLVCIGLSLPLFLEAGCWVYLSRSVVRSTSPSRLLGLFVKVGCWVNFSKSVVGSTSQSRLLGRFLKVDC